MSDRNRNLLPAWALKAALAAAPPCGAVLLCLAALLVELGDHGISAAIGRHLLEDNAERPQRGAVWQGILAARRNRGTVAAAAFSEPADSSAGPAPALTRASFRLVHRSGDFAVLRAEPRDAPWRADALDADALKELAASTQVYRQGGRLLDSVELPGSLYRTRARILAEVALEEGRLFSDLHVRLRRAGDPQAYDFIRMSAADRRYWRQRLQPAVAAYGTATGLADTTTVQAVAYAQFDTWADSLHALDQKRLRRLWHEGAACEIRLLRYMDGFRGYFQPKGEHPYRFDIPAERQTAARALLEPR